MRQRKNILKMAARKPLTQATKPETFVAMTAPTIMIGLCDARPTGAATGAITQAWLWWREIPSAAASMRLW